MSTNRPVVRLNFEAIGTQWVIDLWTSASHARALSKQLTSRIAEFDRAYSRFRSDSWVATIRKPGTYQVPHDFKPLYDFYRTMHTVTNGLVTPLIGDVLERAGYDAQYSLQPGPLRKPADFSTSHYLNGDTLHVKYSGVLDFGAAGKGYLIDILATILGGQGIDFVIDAGGDICDHSPATPDVSAPVGLEDPDDPSRAVGEAHLPGLCIAGSAGNRRKWANFHHIMNPQTLLPIHDIKAVWAIANSAMLADGLATCLFFVKPLALRNVTNYFEYVIIKADNSSEVSRDFPGILYETAR